jgi:hypothetical protein
MDLNTQIQIKAKFPQRIPCAYEDVCLTSQVLTSCERPIPGDALDRALNKEGHDLYSLLNVYRLAWALDLTNVKVIDSTGLYKI